MPGIPSAFVIGAALHFFVKVKVFSNARAKEGK